MSERGSTLLDVLVVGFLGVLIVGQSLITVGRLAGAGSVAEEAAHVAAVIAADSGDLGLAHEIAANFAPGADVGVVDHGLSVTVTVNIDVAVVGPSSSPVTMGVRGEATIRRSPYRSGP